MFGLLEFTKTSVESSLTYLLFCSWARLMHEMHRLWYRHRFFIQGSGAAWVAIRDFTSMRLFITAGRQHCGWRATVEGERDWEAGDRGIVTEKEEYCRGFKELLSSDTSNVRGLKWKNCWWMWNAHQSIRTSVRYHWLKEVLSMGDWKTHH